MSTSINPVCNAKDEEYLAALSRGVVQSFLKHWQWRYLFVVLLFIEASQMYKVFLLRPVSFNLLLMTPCINPDILQRNLKVIGKSTFIGHWMTGLIHMINAQNMVSSAYKTVGEITSILYLIQFYLSIS